MSISSHYSENEKTLTISIRGRFDFGQYNDFRSAYEQLNNPSTNYVLDFSSTEYIDSSALGMLLVMREYAGGDSAKITIKNCNPQIKKILTISNFEKMFAFN